MFRDKLTVSHAIINTTLIYLDSQCRDFPFKLLFSFMTILQTVCNQVRKPNLKALQDLINNLSDNCSLPLVALLSYGGFKISISLQRLPLNKPLFYLAIHKTAQKRLYPSLHFSPKSKSKCSWDWNRCCGLVSFSAAIII